MLNRMDIHLGGRMKRSGIDSREGIGGELKVITLIFTWRIARMVAPTAKMRLHASLAGARASEQELTERVQRGHRHERKGRRSIETRRARCACSRALH